MLHGVRQVVNLKYFSEPLFYMFKKYYLPPLSFFTVNVKRRYTVHRSVANAHPHFARPQNPAKKTSVRVRTPT
jgi:hypothetical protein